MRGEKLSFSWFPGDRQCLIHRAAFSEGISSEDILLESEGCVYGSSEEGSERVPNRQEMVLKRAINYPL